MGDPVITKHKSALSLGLLLLAAGIAQAAVVPRRASRFDRVAIPDPSGTIGVIAETPDGLPGYDAQRAGWAAFKSVHGGGWEVWIDRRSGAPLLVQGQGIRWFPADAPFSVTEAETKARELVRSNEATFKIRESQLVLNREGSAAIDKDHGIVVFSRTVDGIRVEGQTLTLLVTRGNLVAFGTSAWGTLDRAPAAAIDEATARQLLYTHMGILPGDVVRDLASPERVLLPTTTAPRENGPYAGIVGAGTQFRLVWRFVLGVRGEPGTWAGSVDAVTGGIVALVDDTKYAQATGGVYPVSDDQLCPDGCEQSAWPMPYADLSINASPQTADDMGIFNCSPTGGTAVSHLAGPYVRVNDLCGPVAESITCDNDLDFKSGTGTDCQVPPNSSPGNTHSARTSFYHLNRIAEKGRAWLPSNAWLQQQLTDTINLNQICNAYWDGVAVNFFKSGGGCNNTGEIAGVFLHEWGHGLDANDGGSYDNPTEAYADITALVSTHVSCVGRGFYQTHNCSGYGDACLNCTGIRDQDWNMHASHTPATPQGFASSNCPGGGDGPCGKEQHCEAYVSAEAIFDLATRDLTAAGLDVSTAWQLTDKLWYKSRQGSGGNAYNCALPSSDGCGAGSWYTKLRNIDDDDGNLANGTPHAAAIFAAFNRHGIACGASTDAANTNHSSCPALGTPALTATPSSNSVTLTWNAVPDAASYLILRNDQGCASGHTIVATVAAPTTTYTDSDLPDDFTVYYAVQAQGATTACESALSSCQSAAPQPFAGSIKLGQQTYACTSNIPITVRDANIGANTTTAAIWSSTEATPETVTLTATSPGSSTYTGTIPADAGPAVTGNGVLSIANGGVITAQYIDADDGQGGHNLARQTNGTGDCAPPAIFSVAASGINDVRAEATWGTNESSSSIVHYGPVKPPAGSATAFGITTAHDVLLTGLSSCTVYWYSVESQDPAGNVVVDTNGGQYYHFETQGDLGSGLQSCHAGKVTLGKSVAACSDTIALTVTDLDLNVSPSVADTVQVTVSSTTETTPETITLTETGPNTSQFTGSIQTATGAPTSDGKIQVNTGDIVSVTYRDVDDGTGVPAISEASAGIDCVGAGTTLVDLFLVTDESAFVHYLTTEPTTGRVDWGPTAALGNTVNVPTLGPEHSVGIGRLAECGPGFFRITTNDAYGNTSVLDNNGSPYAFATRRIPPGVFKDTFEASSGWTLGGDWEIASPQGKGTSPADPASAYEGTKVLGEDLSGLGAHPGDYEPNVTATATSPQIDATALSSGQLRFRRKLSSADGGVVTISVIRNGLAQPVWSSSSTINDSDWTLQTVNLSPWSDGSNNVKIEFKQEGGASLTHSGWTIDRLIVNSANSPAFEACGGCGLAPSFAGLVSAKDAGGCADTGVTLAWNAAAAWGSGRSGTYVIYRDATPAFVPSASNKIAQGVTGGIYTDTTAPNDVTLYYLVRAENNETCGTGPNNHGVVDANTVYFSARDELAQPVPSGVGNTLLANGINRALIRLSWSAAANAASYHVYRGPLIPFGRASLLASPGGTIYEDRDEYPTATSWYYLVKSSDTCGNEAGF